MKPLTYLDDLLLLGASRFCLAASAAFSVSLATFAFKFLEGARRAGVGTLETPKLGVTVLRLPPTVSTL